ncbi:hypothetical protein Plhal304r1_c030g0098251 [Plasmopara halstedii]
MAEPLHASRGASAVAIDIENFSTTIPASISSTQAGKRSASEAFDGDIMTTLDDVLVSPLDKRTKLLDEELPDVDDNEEFIEQEEDLDTDLALGLKNDENGQELDDDGLILANKEQITESKVVSIDHKMETSELSPAEEGDGSKALTSQNNEIDIVDVDEGDEEDEEDEEDSVALSEQYDDQEIARTILRAQNQREARNLLQQLDDSARSKLCLMALEKYGEELFYGHEEARDAILVDACAQDSILSLMRDAVKVRDLYLGSSATAPVELDDDEETGGYEDEEEEDEIEDEIDESNEEIVVISEEEDKGDLDEDDEENENATTFGNASDEEQVGSKDVSEEEETEGSQNAALCNISAASDDTTT